MDVARITAGGQARIPKPIRDAVGLAEGDTIAFEVVGDYVLMRRVVPDADGYLQSVTRTMSEWDSPENEAAWRDLLRDLDQLRRQAAAHST